MVEQILCIGQSDSSAGTGIQADIKTIHAFGCYAATAVTAVTAQNTQGIQDIQFMDAGFVKKQIYSVMDDLSPCVVKTGMLANTEIIEVVGDFLMEMQEKNIKVVIDPVMTSRSDHEMMNKEAKDAFKRSMLIYADILTPNIAEAQILTGMEIRDPDMMCHAAEMLMTLGARTVILKGGSLAMDGDTMYDVLADDDGVKIYTHTRAKTKATHGAGTTLAAGLAACLAKGMSSRAAFSSARSFLHKAIETAEPIGSGHGPLNHRIEIESLEISKVA